MDFNFKEKLCLCLYGFPPLYSSIDVTQNVSNFEYIPQMIEFEQKSHFNDFTNIT